MTNLNKVQNLSEKMRSLESARIGSDLKKQKFAAIEKPQLDKEEGIMR